MTEENMTALAEHLRLYYRATLVPVSLIRGEEIAVSYYPFVPAEDVAWRYMKRMLSGTPAIRYMMKHSILMALIRIPGTEVQILVGPVPETKSTSEDIRKIRKELDLGFGEARDIFRWNERVPFMGRSRFLSMLRFLYTVVAGQQGEPEMEHVDIEEREILRADYVLSEQSGEADLLTADEQSEPIRHNSQEIEKWILGYIEQGNEEELLRILMDINKTSAAMGEITPVFFKNLRYMYVTAVSLASRAAIRGGMDYEQALTMADNYLRKLSALTGEEDLLPQLGAMMVDFTKQVARIKETGDHSALTGAARRFILGHLQEPLSVERIAGEIGRSPSHLSHVFKEDTGMTIAAYIRRERIYMAEMLLSDRRQSLQEIADSLCFSSLPHFEKVFKEVTGMTPGAYRRR